MTATVDLPQSQSRLKSLVDSITPALVGALIGLVIGGVLIVLAGANVIEVYASMLHGAFGGTRQNPVHRVQQVAAVDEVVGMRPQVRHPAGPRGMGEDMRPAPHRDIGRHQFARPHRPVQKITGRDDHRLCSGCPDICRPPNCVCGSNGLPIRWW